jgi:polysaccharide pyruvyl transferase WcaK-like protein
VSKPRIALLDTSLESDNEGDRIIVESILRAIPELVGVRRFTTHRHLTMPELVAASRYDFLVLTGTNAFTSIRRPAEPWRLGVKEVTAFRGKVIPVGVGWRGYEGALSQPMVKWYRRVFAPGMEVSVRDSHSELQLRTAGIPVVNTTCPTLWSLPDLLPPSSPVPEVVATVTYYAPMASQDQYLLAQLAQRFVSVSIWPQSYNDLRYLEQLQIPTNVTIIEPGLESFDHRMIGRAYVGTRLHAGIRAAQLGQPALVVAVDNRAREIGADTCFPVIMREHLETELAFALEGLFEGKQLTIPRDAISGWRHSLADHTGIGR